MTMHNISVNLAIKVDHNIDCQVHPNPITGQERIDVRRTFYTGQLVQCNQPFPKQYGHPFLGHIWKMRLTSDNKKLVKIR